MARTEKFRFYRSNLATIVWNKETDRPLAVFEKGQFLTTNPEVAQKLIDLGYPRIPLKATEPPDILFQKGEILKGDVKLSPSMMDETAALNKEKAESALKQSTSQEEPEEPEDETEPDVDESPAEVVKKKATKAKAKRTAKPKAKRTIKTKTAKKTKK